MVEAATRLFIRDGYVVTTVESIAVEAGVSAKTVYDTFATKGGVLRGVWDLALKGDLDDAPVGVRPWYLAVLAETDPDKVIARLAKAAVAAKERIGPVLRVIRAASTVDEESAALWALIGTDFHANQQVIVEHLAALRALAPGLTVAKATDVLWTLNHPDVWLLLHDERGWSPREFDRWLAAALNAALLGK
ncbi:MAG: helix-turn-helix domain-containing protein [Acidimicrobiales bacterium]|nr:helix-turn-helix domain-containing protein [Acidimicrobiales bacterium]